MRCGRFTSPHLARYNERICVDGVEANDAEPHRVLRAHRRGARRHHAHVLRIQRARGARSVPPSRGRRRGARSGTRRTARRHQHHRCGCRRGLFDRPRSRRLAGRHARGTSAARRPASFAAGVPRCSAAPICRRRVWAAIDEIGARAVVPGRDYLATRRHASGWDFEFGDIRAARSAAVRRSRAFTRSANAATALAALTALGGIELTHARCQPGAARRAACRGASSVVPGEVEWILDVAHNVPAALGLARESAHAAARAARSRCAEFSATRTSQGITAALARDIDAWMLVTLDGPRAVPTRELAQHLPADARDPGARGRCRRAVAASARAAARPGDRILVFGSFLTVGPALEFLGHIVRPWIREPSND